MASKIMRKTRGFFGASLRFVQLVLAKECLPFATQMGYQMVFLLAPGLLVLIGLLNLLGSDPETLQGIVDLLKAFMPANLHSLIDQQVGTLIVAGGAGTVMSIGFIIGFWLGMSLIGTITRALNRIHEAPPSPAILSRYFISALLLFWFTVVVLGSFNVLLFGERFAEAIEQTFHLDLPLGGIVSFLKYPAVALALCLMACALYLLAPDQHLKWKQILPGAVLFAVGWILFTVCFKIYVERFAHYAEIYLALAGFIILMFWSYATSLCFLLGAVLNEFLRRQAPSQPAVPLALPERASSSADPGGTPQPAA